MQPFNVEIFGTDFELKQHYNVDFFDYSFDYLSITENVVMVPFDESVQKGDYIRLKSREFEFSGYISSLSIDENLEGYTNIGFRPFMGLFDRDVVFPTSVLSSVTLEETLANIITANWIENSDSEQNIYGLEVETISNTTGWTFYLEDSTQGNMNRTIVNLVEISQLSLSKYKIGLFITANFATKKITCQVGKKSIGSFYIEADLPNILDRQIVVNENATDVNKLIVYAKEYLYDSSNYRKDFYLHTDGTYSAVDTDRIIPVIYEIKTIPYSSNFAYEAGLEADKFFGNTKKSNLIELVVANNDKMISLNNVEIGQEVKVITNGEVYDSLLTGFEIGTTTKFTFGTVRLDLTKILKEALK